MAPDERLAAGVLGWAEASWDEGHETHACKRWWRDLSEEQAAAAAALGYVARDWDTEKSVVQPLDLHGGPRPPSHDI
jgi:hypothetical protein